MCLHFLLQTQYSDYAKCAGAVVVGQVLGNIQRIKHVHGQNGTLFE